MTTPPVLTDEEKAVLAAKFAAKFPNMKQALDKLQRLRPQE